MGDRAVAGALLDVPLFAAATLKIVYDLALYRSFAALRAPEETS